MEIIAFLLLLIAFLVFVYATFTKDRPRYNLVALGLALVTLALMFQGIDGVHVEAN